MEEALGLAYRYLGMRDRTVAEVRGHLNSRGIAAAQSDACVHELCEQGYLDDARFAQRFAEDRRALDGWGGERIGARLLALGVDRALVEGLAAERAGADELAAAVGVLRGRLGSPPGDDRERRRALALLVRRGYDLDLAYEAVRHFEAEAA
jgi:regulatory protein